MHWQLSTLQLSPIKEPINGEPLGHSVSAVAVGEVSTSTPCLAELGAAAT
jgi:hypothetical protein